MPVRSAALPALVLAAPVSAQPAPAPKPYQVAALDEEKRHGFVQSCSVVRPCLHTSEDRAAFERAQDRRWELTLNHWNLPIHEIDPHAPAE